MSARWSRYRDAYHRALVEEQAEGHHAWLARWGWEDFDDEGGNAGEEIERFGTPELRVRVYFIREGWEAFHSIELEEWDYEARRWWVIDRSPRLSPNEYRWTLADAAQRVLARALDPVAAALADAHPGTMPSLERA